MKKRGCSSKNAIASISVACCTILASVATFAECRDILEQGIRNTYQSLRTSSMRSAFTEGFCNKSIQKVQNSSGGGISIGFPVDGIPVDIGGNYSQAGGNSLQQELCANKSGDMNDAQYEKLLSSVADPNIVEAWKQCEGSSGGLLLTGKLNGSTLVLSISFRNVGAISSTNLTDDATYDGLQCKTPWLNGMKVDGSTRYLQCKRIGTDPVTVTVNSSFNGAMFYIPPPPQWAWVESDKKKLEPDPAPPDPCIPHTVTMNTCIQKSNSKNRCPADDHAATGSQCSCTAPPGFTPFSDGAVIPLQVTGVIQVGCTVGVPGVLPAPK